jgi:hypothetical protein
MSLRDWSPRTVLAIWLVWPAVLTGLLWGPTFAEIWKARGQGDQIFVVAHTSWWIAFAALLVGPPLVLTVLWYRARST